MTCKYVDIDKTSKRFSQTHIQDPNNKSPKTLLRPQSPMFIRDKIDYSKLYHPVKGGKCNTDGNFEENIDLSEHILKRLRKATMLEINWGILGKIVIVDQIIMLHWPHHQ